MQSVAITETEAPTVSGMIENDWLMVMPDVARNAAWFLTMLQELGPAELTRVIGPDNMQAVQALVANTERLFNVAEQLDAGEAYLVPWQATAEEGGTQHVAVARMPAPASGGHLAGWPIWVAGAVAVSLVGIAVLISKWETEVETLRENNAALELSILQRIQVNAEALMKTDPAAAARIMEANAKAIAAQNAARANPKNWLQQAFKAAGEAIGQVPALAWALGLYVLLQFVGNKR